MADLPADTRLAFVGDGPERAALQQEYADMPNVKFMVSQHHQVTTQMFMCMRHTNWKECTAFLEVLVESAEVCNSCALLHSYSEAALDCLRACHVSCQQQTFMSSLSIHILAIKAVSVNVSHVYIPFAGNST